jgi:hypothetical protein
MKNNAKFNRDVMAVIGITLLVAGITRIGQARDFADQSKFTKIEIPAALANI